MKLYKFDRGISKWISICHLSVEYKFSNIDMQMHELTDSDYNIDTWQHISIIWIGRVEPAQEVLNLENSTNQFYTLK